MDAQGEARVRMADDRRQCRRGRLEELLEMGRAIWPELAVADEPVGARERALGVG